MRLCSSISRARSFRVQARENAVTVINMDMRTGMGTDTGMPADMAMSMVHPINLTAGTARTKRMKNTASAVFFIETYIIKNYAKYNIMNNAVN